MLTRTKNVNLFGLRVLGDLIREGVVMKIADDLYIGGDSIGSLLHNWERVLHKFECNHLKLSAAKSVICPITTTILGWIWSAGSISVSPHKLNPLATADKPSTVKGLRSWFGAYKHIKECIPQYSMLLADLEAAVAGKDSHERVIWTDSLNATFRSAQLALKDPKSIVIPKPSDLLVITNDGAVRNGGVGSVLYIMRNGTMRLGGYYSAKLKPHQLKWLPCEIEALAISSAINHWGPYLIESNHQTQVLSDSKPCIQAYEKLTRGEFSSSARVSTFLSTLSRYHINLQHISGSANIPADYLSRNPMECDTGDCQICKFLLESDHATIRNISVADVLLGKLSMPFTSIMAWKKTQHDCPALRRTYSHLSQGTRPSKKMTKIRNVKRYLQVATIGRDGVLVVKQSVPFTPVRNLIIVPQQVLSGLITALHLRLQHPSKSQLVQVFNRHFYALDSDAEIKFVTAGCAQCSSLATFPKEIVEFSTSQPTSKPGSAFACDVLVRARQKILVIRDTFTSFTVVKIIQNEQKESLRSAIIETTAELKAVAGATIRVDGSTALQSLVGDPILARHGLSLEVGRLKNRNKNPVAEKAIQEIEVELKKQHPDGGPLSASHLSIAIATLNSRIRNRGLSAKEILFQRDHMTGDQLNISDSDLACEQHKLRLNNHIPSAKSQAPKGKTASRASVSCGDLVYLKCDGTKHTARDRYIVTSCTHDFVTVKKLVGSQFRSKEYKLKYSEIYCVPCAALTRTQVPHTRSSPYDSESSEDSNADDLPMPRPDLAYLPRPRSPSEVPQYDQPASPSSPTLHAVESTSFQDHKEHSSRPTRSHNPPSWMQSDDWSFPK